MLEVEEVFDGSAKIKVVGVGGGGGNAVNTMVHSKLEGVEFIAANTDLQALNRSLAPIRLQLGGKVTRGLGSGGDPLVGRNAANEDADKIRQKLEGADMVFVTAGMSGADNCKYRKRGWRAYGGDCYQALYLRGEQTTQER